MIYVIQNIINGSTFFKIGTTSKCPTVRIKQIQRNNVSPLKLVAGLIGTRDDEAMLHEVFNNYRVRGEWFSDNAGIRRLIKDFPISKWFSIMEAIEDGSVTLEDAYIELTLLSLKDRETALAIAGIEVPERILSYELRLGAEAY